MSSWVTRPSVTPNSSLTTATCTKSRCMSASRRRIGLRPGTRRIGLQDRRDVAAVASRQQLHQVLQVDDAEDLVDRALVDQHARVALLEHLLEQVAGRRLDGERDDLGARHHDLRHGHGRGARRRADDLERVRVRVRVGLRADASRASASTSSTVVMRARLFRAPRDAAHERLDDAIEEHVHGPERLVQQVERQRDRRARRGAGARAASALGSTSPNTRISSVITTVANDDARRARPIQCTASAVATLGPRMFTIVARRAGS